VYSGEEDVIAFFVGMCAIGLGVLACLLYLAWAGLSLAVEAVGGSVRRARGRAVPRPASLQSVDV
jgi:hypothetical protein